MGGLKLPEETGRTLEENAKIKAVYAAKETGLPAVSVPFGAEQGLRVGMQVVGRAFEEAALLRAARALEEENA